MKEYMNVRQEIADMSYILETLLGNRSRLLNEYSFSLMH